MDKSMSPSAPVFVLSEGKIVPPTHCELIVTDHCNISCQSCNHASPTAGKWNLTPDAAARDLARLGPVYRPRELRLIGGEPMLNPMLPDILRVARAADFAPMLRLVTNGLLLDRLPDDALALLDEVEVSRYPAVPIAPEAMAVLRKRAARVGTRVTEATYASFRATFALPRSPDALAETVFRGCKVGTLWACHAIRKGRFYKCPQSIYIPGMAKIGADDGFDLHGHDDLFPALWAHLHRHERMSSCHHCLGTMGRKFPHALVDRRDWARGAEAPAQDNLDPDLFAKPIWAQSRADDCRTVSTPRRPLIARAFGRIRRALTG